jgi:hypothetical protein
VQRDWRRHRAKGSVFAFAPTGWFPKDVPESSQPVVDDNEDVLAIIPTTEDVVERPSSPLEERVVRVLVKKITPRKKNV